MSLLAKRAARASLEVGGGVSMTQLRCIEAGSIVGEYDLSRES